MRIVAIHATHPVMAGVDVACRAERVVVFRPEQKTVARPERVRIAVGIRIDVMSAVAGEAFHRIVRRDARRSRVVER